MNQRAQMPDERSGGSARIVLALIIVVGLLGLQLQSSITQTHSTLRERLSQMPDDVAHAVEAVRKEPLGEASQVSLPLDAAPRREPSRVLSDSPASSGLTAAARRRAAATSSSGGAGSVVRQAL